jgi:hypothetical protein
MKREEKLMSRKNCWRFFLLQGAAVVVCSAQWANAGNVSVNVNLGAPPVIVAPPPAVYVPAPEPVYAPSLPAYDAPVEVVEVRSDIDFVYPAALGFYVAVGVPYDLYYVDDCYFHYRDGRWLRARSSGGPWVAQRYRDLPPALRRQRVERIREYRDREYVIYSRDRDHYRGRHFRSDKELWKERRREAKALGKDERRYEKERRKDRREYEKELHKEERRHEKEARREFREGRGD